MSLVTPRKMFIFAAALFSLLLAAIAASNRVPWVDEGLFSSASFNLAHFGFMGTTVINSQDLHLTRIESHTYWVMPLYLLGQAAWLKIFPATIIAVRSFTILWIPVVLFSFHRFCWRITSNLQASALAVCLLALSFIFIDNAAFARPDVMCCTLGLSGLASYVEWRETHFYRALLVSNAFIAASGLTHPNGIFHFLGLVTVFIFYDRRRFNLRTLSTAALPYVLFGIIWSAYIFQDYQAFIDQMRGNGTNGRWAAGLNPVSILYQEVQQRYLMAFGVLTGGWALMKVLALVVYLASVAAALFQPGFRSLRSTRLILLLVAVYFAAMCVFNQKLAYYLVHIVPWYIALTAFYIDWLWQRQRVLRPALIFVVAALICTETGGILLKAYKRGSTIPDEQAAIEFARAHSGPHDRIAGSAALIYGFQFDPRLSDDPRLGTMSGNAPDIIIIDPVYRNLYDALAQGTPPPAWQFVRAEEAGGIAKRLTTYRLAFSNGSCQVYLRPSIGSM